MKEVFLMGFLLVILLFLDVLVLSYFCWVSIFNFRELSVQINQLINRHFSLELVLLYGILCLFGGMGLFIANDFVMDMFSWILFALGILCIMPIYFLAIRQLLNKK